MKLLTAEDVKDIKQSLPKTSTLVVENRAYEILLCLVAPDNPKEILGKISSTEVDSIFQITGEL